MRYWLSGHNISAISVYAILIENRENILILRGIKFKEKIYILFMIIYCKFPTNNLF